VLRNISSAPDTFSAQFSRYISSLEPGCDRSVKAALELVAGAVQQGHVCINLGDFSAQILNLPGSHSTITLPALDEWQNRLNKSCLVGRPGDYAPLILDHAGRLYLARYWYYEKMLADALVRRARETFDDFDVPHLHRTLDKLFPATHDNAALKAAVATVVLKRLTVISGGPGTGKTTAIKLVLEALCSLNGSKSSRIVLAAPTGKAALRMLDALRTTMDLNRHAEYLSSVPDRAFTVHRLLEGRPESNYFRYNSENRLPLDVLVVDEASMLDLALMAKLVAAVPDDARLILLGDKDQLASVEAGAIFGDICAQRGYDFEFCRQIRAISGVELVPSGTPVSPLGNSITLFERSYRFDLNSGLGKLSFLIKNNQPDAALNILRNGEYYDVRWKNSLEIGAKIDLVDRLMQGYADYFGSLQKLTNPQDAFQRFNTFKVLSPYRSGETGITRLNRLIEARIRTDQALNRGTIWYHGRPVMILRNDYNLQLFNGDIGITLDFDGEIRVFFESTHSSSRSFTPSRLPEHETAFVTTVHKSQGSEFDHVVVLLPQQKSEGLSRALLYTAVTRARKSVEIWASAELLKATISSSLVRSSGFSDRLHGQS